MRLRFAPKSKRIAAILAGFLLVLRVIDWLVGKLGYLGVFTSPEDFKTMMERAPVWIGSIWSWVAWLGGNLEIVWGFVISPVGTIATLALIVLVLMIDMNKVTRLTRGLWFNVRHAVVEQVWIQEDSALALLKESEWGQLMGPVDLSYFNALSSFGARTGLSDGEKSKLKFRLFLKKTLKSFADFNLDSFKNEEGIDYYDEVALRKFIEAALDKIITKEYGKPPDFSVS